MICKKCGTELEEDAIFCGNCGAKTGYSQNSESSENNERKIEAEEYYSERKERGFDGGDVQECEAREEEANRWEFVYPEITFPSKSRASQKKGLVLPIALAVAVVIVIALTAAVIYLVHDRGVTPSYTEPDNGIEVTDDIIEEEDSEKYTETEFDTADEELVDIDEIESIIAADVDGAEISVYVIDVNHDKVYATGNADNRMSASALINIPILYTVGKETENNSLSFETPIPFVYRYSGRGTISQAQSGEKFELGELLHEMLSYSDNNATNSLLDYFGNDAIYGICAGNGYSSVELQKYLGEVSEQKDNYISASDAANMLYELYCSQTPGINKSYFLSEFRINDASRFSGIGAALSEDNILFLNHNAVTSSIYNEAAIISNGELEYIITVLCNGGRSETSKNTAAKISEYVYNALRA